MYRAVLKLGIFIAKGYEVSLLLVLGLVYTQINLSLFEVGILGMVFVLVQLISSLFAAYVSHRLGSDKAITLSMVLFGASWLVLLLPPQFGTFLCACFCGGLGMGLFEPLAGTYVVANAAERSRGKEVANFGAFGDLGRVSLSSIASSLVAFVGFGMTSIVFGIFALVAGVGSIVFSSKHSQNFKKLRQESYLHELWTFRKNSQYLLADICGMLDSVAGSSLYIFLPTLLLQKGFTSASIGWFVSPVYFGGLMAGRLLLGRLADRIGAARTLIFGEIVMLVLIGCFLFGTGYVFIGVVLFLLGMFTRGTSPVIRLLIADSISQKEQLSKAYSLYSFSTRLALVGGRPFMGLVGGLFGIFGVFGVSALFAGLATLPALGVMMLKNQKQ